MDTEDKTLSVLIAKEAIRELVLLYSRSIDRKDVVLLRTLYTKDATDTHGDTYDGSAEGYCTFIERSLPHLLYSGHHICNHLISVNGEEGEGEVYAICYHIFSDGKGGWVEDPLCARYIDRYRREGGRWRAAAEAAEAGPATQNSQANARDGHR
jgi:SnoaL-like domain